MTPLISMAHGSSNAWLLHSLAWTLLHFVWQGAAVALLVWCALRLIPGRSSRVRYAVALVALALLAALPVVTFAHIAADEYRAAQAIHRPLADFDPTIAFEAGAGAFAVPWTVRVRAALERALPWLLAAWFCGAAIFLARLSLGFLLARSLRTGGVVPVPDALRETFDRLRIRLDVLRAELVESARVRVPTVIGWLRPVVLLPVNCFTGLSTVQIEAILSHELAHIRRHDYLVSVAQSVVEALLFYHPCVWWISRQVRRERECCCDEVAVAAGGDVLAYAHALAALEQRLCPYPELALGSNGGVLTMRIKRMLGYSESNGASQVAAAVVLAVLLSVAAVCSGAVAKAAIHADIQPAAEKTGSKLGETPAPASSNHPTQSLSGGQTVPVPSAGDALTMKWLDQEVANVIMTPEERATFLQLANNDERDHFIEKVLARRGPTFREIQYQRIAWANEHFAADVPGWKTDRGRAYIVYGKPAKITVWPTAPEGSVEVWEYSTPPGQVLRFVNGRMQSSHIYTKPAADALNAARRLDVSVEANSAAQSLNRAEYKQRMDDARQAIERIATPEFREQINQQIAAAMKVANSPEARAKVADSVRLDTMKLKLEIDVAVAATAKVNSAEMKLRLDDALRRLDTPDFSQRVDRMLARADDSAASVSRAQAEPSVQPNPAPKPVRVSGGVVAGNIESKVDPVYPAEAKQQHIQGAVVLRALISKTGDITALVVVSGPKELQASALDAVKQWKYKPYLLNGQPTAVDTTITVNYRFGGASPIAENDPPDENGVVAKRIGNGVSAPLVLYSVEPQYDEQARADKVSGSVLVHLWVDEQGKPIHVQVLRSMGHGLDEKAIEAVKQYKFKPAMENGVPVTVAINIEVNFQVF